MKLRNVLACTGLLLASGLVLSSPQVGADFISSIAVSADTTSSGLEYVTNATQGYIAITGYSGTSANVVIPSYIDGYPVTVIGNKAFCYASSVTSVTIPSTVTEIGEDAFRNSSLESIDIPSSVVSIGSSAFASCGGLTNVTIPDSVTSIGTSAFRYCDNLQSVTLPAYITKLGMSTFSKCKSLTDITLPEGLTYIEMYAFQDCSSLKSITIPSSVTSVSNSAFKDCTNLQTVVIRSSSTRVNDDAFDGCYALNVVYDYVEPPEDSYGDTIVSGTFETNSNATYRLNLNTGVLTISGTGYISTAHKGSEPTTFFIEKYTGPLSSYHSQPWDDYREYIKYVVVNEGITVIGNDIFADCASLMSISLPSSVERIDDGVFKNCTSLANIKIDENNSKYTDINGILFNKDLTELVYYPLGKTDSSYTVPNGIKNIHSGAFIDNTTLTSVTIPSSVELIGNYAFYGCENLSRMNIMGKSVGFSEIFGEISHSYEKYNESLVIYGRSGTSTERFANSYNLTFVDIDTGVTQQSVATTATVEDTEPTVSVTTTPITTVSEGTAYTTQAPSNTNSMTLLSILMVKKHLLGMSSISTSLGDFNHDGTINTLDVIVAKRELLNR